MTDDVRLLPGNAESVEARLRSLAQPVCEDRVL
jgi:hypothetical protein